MKKIKKYIVLLVLFLLAGIKTVNANTYEEQYDEYFASNEITIYTDLEVTDNFSLNHAVAYSIPSYIQEFFTSQYDNSSLSLYSTYCNYDELKCNFELSRSRTQLGVNSYEKIKEYNNITINIDSNVSNYFSMVENNTLTINYDENLFTSDEEKQQYISTYFNNFSEYKNGISTYYGSIYDGNNIEAVRRTESKNGEINKSMIKKVSNVVFDYTEEPYSDNFKVLTSGTITIKSETEITNEILNDYLNNFHISNTSEFYYFSIDGNIVNNKAFIVMKKNNAVVEKHLVTIVQDNNVNVNIFENYGAGVVINIPAAEPTNNVKNYVSNYVSNILPWGAKNEDNSYDYFSSVYLMQYNNYVIIRHNKNDSEGKLVDIEYHKVNVNFVGYSNTYSDKFNDTIGNEFVIRGDYLEYYVVSNALPYPFRLLGCNNDCSICDILYHSSKEQITEVHPVSIVLNNEITDTFIEAVGLKIDKTIDILMDEDIDFTNSYNNFHYSYYNPEKEYSVNYNCTGDECNISVGAESHKIKFNRVNATPSESYLAQVKETINIYPGDNEYVWDSLRYNSSLFSKNEYDNKVTTYTCDEQKSKCIVMAMNSNNKLEMHYLTINLLEGKSPRFNELFPGDTIKINSVYKNDADYVYYVSIAYLMGKTKSWSYLENYADGKATVSFDTFEKHRMNVEFAEGNEEHQQIVNNIISNIGSKDISVYMDDLEMVNIFYYGGIDKFPYVDSKSINEKLTSLINNDHVTYSFAVFGGLGNPFYEELGTKLVLFYDGIGYGVTESDIKVGVRKVLYIPDDTEESSEAYIAAAQNRIDNYLGANSGVSVKYGWAFNPEDEEITDIVKEYEISNFDNNIYNITYQDREDNILIVKDSSKIKDATFNAIDINNNIIVSSDNASYPMNTIVSGEKITKEDYEEELAQIGVENAMIYDINLYSPSEGDIKDFNGKEFEVSVPIDKTQFNSDNLVAYYLAEDGTVEKHPVEVSEYYGKFATTHFSTYVIGEDNEEEPDESDLIPVYRMFNPVNGEHLYTTDAYEVKVIYETQGWGFEGIGWYTSKTGTPVYRLYQPQLGNHLYTSDLHEIEVITTTQGWVKDFDGAPVMYSNGDIPIFRLFNPGLQGQHHLTTDFNEYNVIPIWGWQQEGISMKAVKAGVPITTYYYKDSHKPIDFENIKNNVL